MYCIRRQRSHVPITVHKRQHQRRAQHRQHSQTEPEPNRGIVIDIDNDPYLSVFDSPLYDFMNECDDPDFDPYLAALDEEYFKSYTGCKDPECEVHGTPPPPPPEIDFDPNDYHY